MENPQIKELKILENYKKESHVLVNQRFNKIKSQKFTSKYIEKLLNTPDFTENLTQEDCDFLENLNALEVQKMLKSDSKESLESIVNKYHFRKKQTKNEKKHLTWSFYAEPISQAKQLDNQVKELSLEETKKTLPLYGFVLSVKDSIYVKNSPSTSGLFINLDRIASKDPETITKLKNAGAVITSKGNIPQLLFSMESNNNIFGDCHNPFDSSRTSGGSSGGDCALIASGMVNAALGSDGAGSLRIPALFCGIDAFKPSPHRLSIQCHASFFSRGYGSEAFPQKYFAKGDEQFIALKNIGPLARTVTGLGLLESQHCFVELMRLNLLHIDYPFNVCLLYTSPSPRDLSTSRMPSSA